MQYIYVVLQHNTTKLILSVDYNVSGMRFNDQMNIFECTNVRGSKYEL